MAQAEIVFNEREALRYFRAAPGDTQAQVVVRQVYEELKTEMQPRYTVKNSAVRCIRKINCCNSVPNMRLRSGNERRNGTIL